MMAAPIHLNLVYFPSSFYKTSMLLRLAPNHNLLLLNEYIKRDSVTFLIKGTVSYSILHSQEKKYVYNNLNRIYNPCIYYFPSIKIMLFVPPAPPF